MVALVMLVITMIDGDLYAQIDLPDDGNVDDVPMAPINGLIGIAMAVGSYLGYKKLKNNKQ
ncbi:hypothetical protein [Nonlabens sp. YIK11]|uniref:hypothetical protein n=1 Tax=Nonlabens sp. YIK11 TaxID=1453349 RepID=UPI0012E29391|nr:hypothetical protein [Nonlabens sp. YIK11]